MIEAGGLEAAAAPVSSPGGIWDGLEKDKVGAMVMEDCWAGFEPMERPRPGIKPPAAAAAGFMEMGWGWSWG